jgi:hypothetical protein
LRPCQRTTIPRTNSESPWEQGGQEVVYTHLCSVEELLGYLESRDVVVGEGAVAPLCAPRLSKISRVFGVERRRRHTSVSHYRQ